MFTPLVLANTAMRQGYYHLAQSLYVHIYHEAMHLPQLQQMVQFNLLLMQALTEHSLTENELEQRLDRLLEGSMINQSLVNLPAEALFTDVDLECLAVTQEQGLFFADGSDPSFLVCKDFLSGDSGFYKVTFVLFTEQALSRQRAKIYLNYGEGFNEADAIAFVVDNGRNERVFYLSKPPASIRFDPFEQSGVFVLFDFAFSKIDENHKELTCYLNQKLNKDDELHVPRVWCALPIEKTLAEKVPLNVPDNVIDKTNNINDKRQLMQLYELYAEDSQSFSTDNTYAAWIRRYENDEPTQVNIDWLTEQFAECTNCVFSIIIPTYNTNERHLRECLDSVLQQSFGNFEVCIADDRSTKPHVAKILREYQALDSRIKVVYRSENGHISQASNTALTLATGKYIVLLDHDDMLAKHALYYVAERLIQYPDAKIIYSDEDFIDDNAHRMYPHFKSDWNPDLFFSHNYVTHLCVYDAALIEKIGGFRLGVEGSQDQDLLLRAQAKIDATQIHHISRVLYHWRAVAGSTAHSAGAKNYTSDAGLKALQDYFVSQDQVNVVVSKANTDNFYRVLWPLPKVLPKVSLIIPTRDAKDITEQAVRSILQKTTYANYEVVIVDNGSEHPETLAFFEQIQKTDNRVHVIRYDYPFNYSAINNFAVQHTDGEIIGLINNDIEVISADWLTEMVRHASRPDIGCVGVKLYYDNNTVQHAGVIIGLGGYAGHSHKHAPRDATGYFNRLQVVQNLSAVTGACLLVRRKVYEQVGGLDEHLFKVAYNDVDFCLKVKAEGYRNLWTPYAELYHHESISRGYEDSPEKIARFNQEKTNLAEKWRDVLRLDPYYSPHLTHAREDFSLNDE